MEAREAPFQIRNITVDPGANSLRRDGRVERVPFRLMQLLCLLAQVRGETVSREALVNALWPRGHVNEEALSRAVAELRRALGDDARKPSFIETIPKKGYRLLPEVMEPTAAASSGASKSGTVSPIRFGVSVLAGLAILSGIFFWLQPEQSEMPRFNSALLASAQRLTADQPLKYHADLSPDGQFLAYTQTGVDRVTLNIVSTRDPDQRRSYGSLPSTWSPVFDPSGKYLAVVTSQAGQCQIERLTIESSERRPLGNCRLPNFSGILDWSEDGQWIALVNEDEATGSSGIFMLATDSMEQHQVTWPGDPYLFDTRPRVSPDGRWLAFTRGTRAAREIWLQALDESFRASSEPTQLSFDHQFIAGVDWSSDGRFLVLDSERSGFRALWALDLSGAWTLLGARDAQSPAIAGDQVVFHVTQYEANIWRMNIETGELDSVPLLASTKYDSNPAWSPDGQEIAFSSNRSGKGALWLAGADGSRARMIYEPGEGRVVGPAWSADGRQLVATRYSPRGQDLVGLTLASGEVRVIPTSGIRPFGGEWSQDGQWLYYIAGSENDGTRLWRQASDAGSEAKIWVDRPVNRFRIEGEWMLFTLHDQDGLFRIPAENPRGEPDRIADLLPGFWDDWTSHQGWAYFPALSSKNDGQYVLVKTAIAGGELLTISEYPPSALGPNMDVSPDGKSILVARTDRIETDIFGSRLFD